MEDVRLSWKQGEARRSGKKYIDASELNIARGNFRSKYPYQEWIDTIPKGKALDITDECDGVLPGRVSVCIRTFTKRHQLPITAIIRRGRVYVIREKDDA